MSRFRRGTYDNSHNYFKERMDARPQSDPAVAAGMRGIHRDSRGKVIGGYTAEGEGIGTKSRFRQPGGAGAGVQGANFTPRLDAGVQTPRLDSRQDSGLSFADQEKAARARSAASGAFGGKAQNLEGRRSLFRDMQVAGSGAITPDMEKRAAALGVKKSRFRETAGNMAQVPSGLARPVSDIPSTTTIPKTLARSSMPETDQWKASFKPAPMARR